MTKEEAIMITTGARMWLTACDHIWDNAKVEEALNMAIEALEKADRLAYVKIYADDEPSRKAEKLYQICGAENEEVAGWLKEYFPSADRPKNMIHIDEVYRLIAGHSNYHGDSILSAFTCLVEGKDVKPIAPLDESADRPTGEWVFDDDEGEYVCSGCKRLADINTTTGEWVLSRYCGDCGAYMVNNNSVHER